MAGPTRAVDMTGKRCGILTVLHRDGQYPGTKLAAWRCRCDCGVEKTMLGSTLRTGASGSCGCRNSNGPPPKHGKTHTSIYNTWCAMLQRCRNKNSTAYHNYGGRGIKVCERWLTFENFLADMGERPSPGHTVDRKDNDGNYEPGNCHWATWREQANNTRRNRRFETPVGILSIFEIAKVARVGYQAIQLRIRAGLRGAELIATNKRLRSTTSSIAAREAASR